MITQNTGEFSHRAKLTQEDVDVIVKLKSDGVSAGELGEMFSVNKRHIYRIVSGERWATGSIIYEIPSKMCSTCGVSKHTDMFGNSASSLDGLRSQCKDCERVQRDKYKEENSEWLSDYHKNWKLMDRYGISLEEWKVLFESQNHCCAICKTKTPGGKDQWHTDHNHDIGVVRGILCFTCNIVVGYVEKGWTITVPAITQYLEDHRALANCEQGRGEALLCS